MVMIRRYPCGVLVLGMTIDSLRMHPRTNFFDQLKVAKPFVVNRCQLLQRNEAWTLSYKVSNPERIDSVHAIGPCTFEAIRLGGSRVTESPSLEHGSWLFALPSKTLSEGDEVEVKVVCKPELFMVDESTPNRP